MAIIVPRTIARGGYRCAFLPWRMPALTGGSRTRTRVPVEKGRPLTWCREERAAPCADAVAPAEQAARHPSAVADAGNEALRTCGAPKTPGARVSGRWASVCGTQRCARRDYHAIV